jgi:hypothetical protein
MVPILLPDVVAPSNASFWRHVLSSVPHGSKAATIEATVGHSREGKSDDVPRAANLSDRTCVPRRCPDPPCDGLYAAQSPAPAAGDSSCWAPPPACKAPQAVLARQIE